MGVKQLARLLSSSNQDTNIVISSPKPLGGAAFFIDRIKLKITKRDLSGHAKEVEGS